MGDKLKDIISSAKGEVEKILLEKGLPAIAGEVLEEFLTGTVLETAKQATGIAVPGVGNMILSYQQKRMERNFKLYVKQIVQRQEEINNKLDKLENTVKAEIKDKYFGLVSDYVLNLTQEKKIDYIVNGFVNMTSGINLQEDLAIMYYDTLAQLSLLDIRILKLYYRSRVIGVEQHDSIYEIQNEYNLENSQIYLMQEKLVRLGLLESKNEEEMNDNIKNIAEYLDGVSKGKKGVKLKKLKKISRTESYKISSYGRRFIEFFGRENEEF